MSAPIDARERTYEAVIETLHALPVDLGGEDAYGVAGAALEERDLRCFVSHRPEREGITFLSIARAGHPTEVVVAFMTGEGAMVTELFDAGRVEVVRARRTAIEMDALERMTFGHGLSGLELVRRGSDLSATQARGARRIESDLARATIYATEARSYESDAAILAASEDTTTVHCLGGDGEAAHVYAAIAGARWVAVLASLLGGRGPYRLEIEELQRLRGDRRAA